MLSSQKTAWAIQLETDKPLLPSLLDRLTDDSYITHGVSACNTKIGELEKSLQEKADQIDAERRQTLMRELAKNRTHVEYLKGLVGSFESIRDSVKRDLSWLLNTRSFYMEVNNIREHSLQTLDTEKYPHVATSVLNYGLPDLTGMTSGSINNNYLEKMMKQALLAFEPRIMKDSLILKVITENSMQDHNVLIFDIDAMLWAEPAPIHLQLRTELDLETADVNFVG